MHALWTLLAFCSVVAAAVVSAVVICFQARAQMYRGFSLGQFRDQQAEAPVLQPPASQRSTFPPLMLLTPGTRLVISRKRSAR